jgi:hypothetical protein
LLIWHLGVPISDRRLRKADLMDWVEKIADRLPNWKAGLLNLAGRTTLVRFVLSAIPIYLLIAMNIPKWVMKSIDKIRRGFLWKGRKDVNGGNCLVSWDIVTRPLIFGGLGSQICIIRAGHCKLNGCGWRKQIQTSPGIG